MMPKQTRLAMLGVVALTTLALPAAAQTRQADSQATAKKKLYCWDQGGQRICSDTLPSEAVNQARDEFNARSGTRSAGIGRALSAEERAAAAAEKAQLQADQAAQETRKRTDQAMLLSFQSEEELRRVFNERTNIVDNNVHTARYNVASLREGLVSLLRQAGDRDLSGKPVSDKMAANIQQRHRELLRQQRLQASFEQQRADLEGEIEQILQRYRAVKGMPATAG